MMNPPTHRPPQQRKKQNSNNPHKSRRHSKSNKNSKDHDHGFPPQVPARLRRAYAQRGVQRLFQWQRECLDDPALFAPGHENLVYSAPTSAGKTLVAEVLAACNCLRSGRRALFVLPYVSSAREKFLYLQSLWRSVNLTVKAFIGASSASLHGWSAAVCTIEKANALLNALVEAGLAAEIGIVVVDELHMIFDQERGGIIENLLAKLLFISRQSGSHIQLVGMSATLGGEHSHRALSAWLQARAFATQFRPLPLRQFVLLQEGGQILALTSNSSGGQNDREIATAAISEKEKAKNEEEENKENRRWNCWHDNDNVVVGGRNVEEEKEEKAAIGASIAVTAVTEGRRLAERFVIKGDNKCMIGIAMEALIQSQLVLIFCATKAEAEQSAILLAKYLKYCLDKGDANRFPELANFFPTARMSEAMEFFRQKTGCTERDLVHCIGQGVAYHHAGLTVEEREQIEAMFRCGHIRVLVSTSTLSSDVNLPAHRVLIRANATSPVPLSFVTYNQMVGRAGRQGQAQVSEGESYLLCSRTDWPVLQRQICSRRQFVQTTRSMGRLLLETINSSLCTSRADVDALVERCTFSLPQRDPEEELAELEALKLIASGRAEEKGEQTEAEAIGGYGEEEEEEAIKAMLRPTQLGRAVLASSLDLRTAIQVFDGLQMAMQSICLDTELHMLFLVTPINNLAINANAIDWHFFHQQWTELPPELRRVANRIGITEAFFMQKLGGCTFPRGHPTLNLHVRFLASLILFELINERPLQNVALSWKINRGLLQSLQQQAATYAYMIVSFCDRLGWIHLRTLLDGFAERLQFGVRRDLTELVRIQGIDAVRARVFHQQEISSLVALANCSEEKICLILRKAVPFELNTTAATDGDGTVNSWLHGEPAMSERKASKTLLQRAMAAVQEKLSAFQIHSLPNPNNINISAQHSLDLSLRFDSSCLSVLDDEEPQGRGGGEGRGGDDDQLMDSSTADLSTSVLEQAWMSEDESDDREREAEEEEAEEAESSRIFDQQIFGPNLSGTVANDQQEQAEELGVDDELPAGTSTTTTALNQQKFNNNNAVEEDGNGEEEERQHENNVNDYDGQMEVEQIHAQSWEVIKKMERTGMHLERRKAENMVAHIVECMGAEETQIFSLAGDRFNLDSAAEVSKTLFVKMQLPVPEHIVSRNSRRRHLPTSSGVLKQIGHPICERIERWRKLENALGCLRNLLAALSPRDCRVRTHFERDSCTSGRILCHSPNLQFVPKRALLGKYSVRSVFTAPAGRVLVAADYCQLELRVLGALSGDRQLATLLAREDPFEWMAKLFAAGDDGKMVVKIGREKAKKLCYAIIYGMGAENLGKELRMPGGADEARLLLDRFFQLFPRVKCWLDSTVERCKRLGHVQTHFGTRRQFQWEETSMTTSNANGNVDEASSSTKTTNVTRNVAAQQRAVERRCVNFVIQGTAAELFRLAMIRVNARLEADTSLNTNNSTTKLVMQLHDEVITETADGEESVQRCARLLRDCMQSVRLVGAPAPQVPFPVRLAMGRDWGALEPFDLELDAGTTATITRA